MRITTWGAPRALGALLVLSVLAMMDAAGGAAACMPQAADTEGLVKAEWTPLGLRNGMTTVMVQVAGDPSALVEGNANRELSDSEKNSIEANLKVTQAGVEKAVEQLGGTVVADYQAAYNGLKVRRIDRSKTDEARSVANVVAVRPLQLMTPDNMRGVSSNRSRSLGRKPRLPRRRKDRDHRYRHRLHACQLRGPGTVAAFDAATRRHAACRSFALRADRATVKGGYDFVGNDYNADPPLRPTSPSRTRIPTRSTATGTAATSREPPPATASSRRPTYSGPWNATTIPATRGPSARAWLRRRLYALRVFGCEGSTDVTVDAIEWAVENHMDVINMSLGSPFGSADDPSAVASTNAAKAGVTVVASSGNEGPSRTSRAARPAAARSAWLRTTRSSRFPAATMVLSTGPTITGPNSNGFALRRRRTTSSRSTTYPATPLVNGARGQRRGFGSLPANALASRRYRGNCARVAKAIFGQQAGAAAVAMVNNATGYPPFEGKITSNPDTALRSP